MWVHLPIVIHVCLFLGCLSQDTSPATQSSTDPQYSTGTQGIDWDVSIPPEQSSLPDGQRGDNYRPGEALDYTVFDNHWGPMLMQMQSPPYGARIQSPPQSVPNLYPFPQQLNANQINWTDAVGPSGINQAFLPYSTLFFYPQAIPDERQIDMKHPNGDNYQDIPVQLATDKQNYSASEPEPSLYGPSNPLITERQEQIPFPFVNYPPPGYFLRNRADVPDRRNALPIPAVSGLYPYPPPSLTVNGLDVGPQVFPQVNVFVRPPFLNTETGFRAPVPPRDSAPTQAAIISEISERPNAFPPIPPVVIPRPPLPVNPYQFGFLPPNIPPPPPFLPPAPAAPTPPVPPQILPNVPIPTSENLITGPFPQRPPPALLNAPELSPPESPPPTNNLYPPVAESIVESEGLEPESMPVPDGGARHPYEFGYDMNDGRGTDQHRQESANEAGVVTGSYSYRDPFGVYRVVNYIADTNGFRAFVKSNEPGVANPGSADVIVVAERPPEKTIADSLRSPNLDVVQVPDVPGELVVEASDSS